ncbi:MULTISPECIES: diacylglycerol/lipid kinase family protein [unclassified Psychrobacillus]|uniref:diacylglycerol/lipid kinase family protein n=1 Tax=unclassified Psychrobacillus TaxID=2636677 RepID=UPI0011A13272|nr:YegS/Rv2252/BmrU family lipid kinase [Bacillus sp. N3536]
MNNVVIIVNEVAGQGRAKKLWESWKDRLPFSFTLFKTEYSGHATAISKEYADASQEPLLIIAIGGDGTIHEILSGLIGYNHVRVGVVSAGSGNDFGRTFFVFKTIEQLNEYVLEFQSSEYMDMGTLKTNSEKFHFVNNAGFGFDAHVVYAANNSSWKKWLNRLGLGKLVYILYLVKELFCFQKFSFSLLNKEDEIKFEDVWFITVCNQPYFGGGMKISPSSLPNDSLIELTIVHHLKRTKLLFIFGTVFFGKHTAYKEIKQIQAKEFTIQMNDEVYGHVDGEFSCMTTPGSTYTFKVESDAWNLAKPPSKRS